MLKQRLITAFTLGPLSMWAILALPSDIFALIIAVFMVMGAWEWARFTGAITPFYRVLYCGVMVLILLAIWSVMKTHAVIIVDILVLALLWWCVALLFVYNYPKFSGVWGNKPVIALSGYFVLIPCWLALVSLHSLPGFGSGYTLFVIMLMWFADSAAYFGGRQWGKHKLAQQVSPGKTREGVYAALFVSVIFVLIAGYLLGIGHSGRETWMFFMGISLFVVLVSVIGDLTESMFKRQSGVKDSGSLLPGHGGVLDRIDSLTAAAPVFTLALMWSKGQLGIPIASLQDIIQ